MGGGQDYVEEIYERYISFEGLLRYSTRSVQFFKDTTTHSARRGDGGADSRRQGHV